VVEQSIRGHLQVVVAVVRAARAQVELRVVVVAQVQAQITGPLGVEAEVQAVQRLAHQETVTAAAAVRLMLHL
jgi:hypothetical protein